MKYHLTIYKLILLNVTFKATKNIFMTKYNNENTFLITTNHKRTKIKAFTLLTEYKPQEQSIECAGCVLSF